MGGGRAAPRLLWQCVQKDGCAQRTGAHARPKPTSKKITKYQNTIFSQLSKNSKKCQKKREIKLDKAEIFAKACVKEDLRCEQIKARMFCNNNLNITFFKLSVFISSLVCRILSACLRLYQYARLLSYVDFNVHYVHNEAGMLDCWNVKW